MLRMGTDGLSDQRLWFQSALLSAWLAGSHQQDLHQKSRISLFRHPRNRQEQSRKWCWHCLFQPSVCSQCHLSNYQRSIQELLEHRIDYHFQLQRAVHLSSWGKGISLLRSSVPPWKELIWMEGECWPIGKWGSDNPNPIKQVRWKGKSQQEQLQHSWIILQGKHLLSQIPKISPKLHRNLPF